MRRSLGRLCWLWLALVLGSCGETLVARTEVLVLIDAGRVVRQRADTLLVTFFSGKGEVSRYPRTGEELFQVGPGFPWPASLALVPKGGDASRGFRIEVEAREGEKLLVATRVVSHFLAEKTLLLEIVLLDACVGFSSCGDAETCVAENEAPVCRDAKVDPRTLRTADRIPDAGQDIEPPGTDASAREDAMSSADDASQTVQDAAEPTPDASREDAAQSADAATCGAPEDCFNGRDDDCDDVPDCADPDCFDSTRCVPDSEDTLGVVVRSADACPPGYGDPRPLHNNLSDQGCTGCSCGAISATQCSVHVSAACSTQSGSGVQLSSNVCPGGANLSVAQVSPSVSASAWAVQPGSCSASGTATPSPPIWAETVYLCRPTRKGAGCSPKLTCLPMPPSPAEPLCYRPLPGEGCAPDDMGERVWYTGYDDSRSCGPCTCESSGSGCADMRVAISSSCAATPSITLRSSEARCGSVTPSSYYAYLTGSPTNGTCTPRATQNGRTAANGSTVLCCRD